MSDQKPHITASELDHILEQVQKKAENLEMWFWDMMISKDMK